MDDLFKLLIKTSPDSIGIISTGGDILFSNDSLQKLLSNSADTSTVPSLSHADIADELKKALDQAISMVHRNKQLEKFACEYGIGEARRQFQGSVIPHPVSGNDTLLLEIRDNTEICRLQSKVQEGSLQNNLLKERRRRLFFGMLDDLPTFVYMQRKNYTVAYANKRVRTLYGESEEKLCYEVFAGRTSPCPVCPTFKVFDTGQAEEWEFTDNNGRTFLIYDYPYEDEDGESLVLEMGVDITDLKTVEKELYKAQKLKAIGVLAGGIAHDLNNNLVPIIFNIEYAKNKVVDPTVIEPLEDALQAANRAAKLVKQVLEYSRQQDVSKTAIRIGPIIDTCIKEIRNSLPPEISLQFDQEISTDYVFANTAQIQQVAMNLIRNAQHSMPEGGFINILLTETVIDPSKETNMRVLPQGRYIVLEVSDTGIGIRPENLERIFEPFFTSKKGGEGTGMGLAVVHSIVTGSGGDIQVESTPGIGTTFTIFLPEGTPSEEMLQGELCVIDGDNIKILLVDDDPGPLKAISRSLRDSGFTVDTAASGSEGLKMFYQNPGRYNLVLADQSMPGMTGLEMSTKMLAQDKDASVVICTGHIDPALEEQARIEGIAAFARKPMSPKTLKEIVKRHSRYR